MRQLRKARGLSRPAVGPEGGHFLRVRPGLLEAGRYDPTVGLLRKLGKVLGVKVTRVLT